MFKRLAVLPFGRLSAGKRAFTQTKIRNDNTTSLPWKHLLTQPAIWGGGSIFLSLYLPPLAETYLYSTANVSSGFLIACAAFMIPTSVFRGVTQTAEVVMVPAVGTHVSDLVYQRLLKDNPARKIDESLKAELQDLLDSKSALANALQGSGVTGFIVNSFSGLILPSSTVTVEYFIDACKNQTKGSEQNVSLIGTATNALLLSQIASTREKATIFGSGLTLLACGVVLFIDYSSGVVADKVKKSKERFESTAQGLSDATEDISNEIRGKLENGQSSILAKTELLKEKMKDLKDKKFLTRQTNKLRKEDKQEE